MTRSWRPSAGVSPRPPRIWSPAYGDRASRLARGITGNAQDAEEVVQDAFLSVIRRIDTFRGDATSARGSIGSWPTRPISVAGGVAPAAPMSRWTNCFPCSMSTGRHVAPVADWSRSVDDPARQIELRIMLSTAIDELPADYRAIVLLRDVEGLTPGDIAAILDLTVDNVTTRVHRARLFLRKQLEAHLSGQSSRGSGRSVSATDREDREHGVAHGQFVTPLKSTERVRSDLRRNGR